MKKLVICSTLVATMGLTACGGGDEGSTPSNSAEGFWVGNAGSYVANLAVLENGETWGLYGVGSTVVGAVYGQTNVNGATVSGAGTTFNFGARTSGNGTYSGSVSPRSTLNFTASDGTVVATKYDIAYDQAANLADLAGTYSGFGITKTISPQSTTVVVTPNGAISSSYVSGSLSCVTTGTAEPRKGGKNVYNIMLTFTGNFCALGDRTTVNGVGTFDKTAKQVIVLALNSGKTDGLFYVGKRP